MKLCKHQDCAVCSEIEHRKFFEHILNKKFPDVYICPHTNYVAKNHNNDKFFLDIKNIYIGRGGCYTIDPYRAQLIYLNRENFEIECELDECIVKDTYVAEYLMKQHKIDD